MYYYCLTHILGQQCMWVYRCRTDVYSQVKQSNGMVRNNIEYHSIFIYIMANGPYISIYTYIWPVHVHSAFYAIPGCQ